MACSVYHLFTTYVSLACAENWESCHGAILRLRKVWRQVQAWAKPEARSGFQTNKIESVDAVVCCRVGAGSSTHSAGKGQTHGLSPADSPRHWLLWEAAPSLSGLLGVMVCLVLGGTGHYQGHVFTYKQQMGKVSCHQTASPASAPSRAGRPSSCLAIAEAESDMWLACQKEAIS